MPATALNRATPIAQRAQRAQKPRSKAVSMAAPVDGWNKRDALGAMKDLDAVVLENFFPGTTSVILRNGYSQFAAGLGAQVETLMAYSGGTSAKLKAVTAGGNVYDATSGGAVGAAELSALSNGRWQYENFTTVSGSYLCMVNGADLYRVYDGTAWHKDTDGPPYDISGVTSSTLITVNTFKNRLWFTDTSTLKAWYLPVNAIGGAANSLDMSSIAGLGGSLQAMGTWTIDAGYGVDDYAVFVTTKGEVIVWRMTDPTDPTAIYLVGVWQLGAPVGRRCFMKYKGDLLLISQDGLVPLSGALQSSRFNPRVALTDKIQSAVSDAISSYGSTFGWQTTYYPKQNQLYLNVPVAIGSQQQYVMNVITGAWCNFTGWAANCFEIFNDSLYFGGNGIVGKAWDTNADAGAAINAVGLQAFSYWGTASVDKRVTMMRPTLYTNGQPSISGSVNFDFDQSNTGAAPLTILPAPAGIWDSSAWDMGVWGTDLNLQRQWQGTVGHGYAIAPRLQVSSNGVQVQWVATDMVYESGAIL